MLKKVQKSQYVTFLIIISFILLSICNVLLMVVSHKFPYGNDMTFHWQEICELLKSHSIFPRFALNSFQNDGSALPTFYPYLFLYPFALIFHFIKSAAYTTYIILVLNTFISLLICFYSSIKLSRSRSISYVFAVMYSLSFSLFLNTFTSYAVGMNNAFVFMPLVLFGFIYWIKDNHFIMLALGMTFLAYNDVVIATITPVILVLWLILNIKYIHKNQYINLGKAIVLTLLTSAWIWLPSLKLFLSNKLQNMAEPTWPYANGTDLFKSLHSVLSTQAMNSGNSNLYLFTIYAFLGLIVGAVYFKKNSNILKQTYILSIFVIFISSDIFPWKIMNKTPLGVIQFPWRLYLIPQVLLTFLLSIFVVRKIHTLNFNDKWSLAFVVFLVLGLQISNQSSYIRHIGNVNTPNNQVIANNQVNTDYYPQASLSSFNNMNNHFAILNNNINKRIKLLNHGSFGIYSKKDIKSLSLPFLYYRGVNYKYYLGSKLVKSYPNKNSLITVNNIPRGYHNIHISIPLSKTDIIARALTIISFLAYGLILIRKLCVKRHNDL